MSSLSQKDISNFAKYLLKNYREHLWGTDGLNGMDGKDGK